MGDRRHARERRHARAVRRCARLPRRRSPLGARRTASRRRPRRVAHARPRADGARRRARSRARSLVVAHPRVDRRTVERSAVALVLRRRRRRRGARSSTSRGAPKWARVSSRRTSCNRSRRARSAGPRSAWPSTSSTNRDTRCAAQVGELVCTKPWPGMTRGLFHDPERYLETYWSRYPNVWWHGDFASVARRR